MRWFGTALVVVVVLCGLAAGFVANDVPLVARVDGTWSFPALVDQFGLPPRPPSGADWKEWWWSLDPARTTDWAIMPPWPYGPFEVLDAPSLSGPTWEHPLGIDEAGRDVLSRVLHGARTAVIVGLGAVALAMLVGVPVGVFAGLGGGVADRVALRVVEVFTCFPAVLAVLAVATFLGGSRLTIVLVLAGVQWPLFARVTRSELLALREEPFVAAARGVGVGPYRVARIHLFPQLAGPLIVTAAFLAADAILVESTLTFLGLGSGLSSVSWGAMLEAGRVRAVTGAWHAWAVPAAAIAITVVALHGVGERVRVRSVSAGAPG